jgi:hypothetical protein
LRWIAAIIIVAVTAARIVYLFFYCPYDLAPDEGHYWDWSRHLDWSYYSKGPLIAWIIRASCELFGDAALATNGTLMPALRLPAVLCGGGLLAGMYVLTYQTFRSDRLALGVVLVALTLPAVALCSIVMTIDAPFLFCWCWALVFGRWAIVVGKSWAWPITGLLVAIGILAKYTMGLWLFSAGLFLLFTPTYRSVLFSAGFWVMVAVAALSALPILYWNSQNDWVTFRHVAVQSGVVEGKDSTGVRLFGPIEYIIGQALVLNLFWFVVWVAALVRYRPWVSQSPGTSYLWWMSVPTFAVFAISSLRANGQLNWPVAAYLSGAVLVAGRLSEVVHAPWARRGIIRVALWLAVGIGAVLTVIAHDTRAFTYFLAPFVKEEAHSDTIPMRNYDPAARLKGHRELGKALDELRQRIRNEEGRDPVLAGLRWDYPGLLGFYTDGHPQAFSFGLVLKVDRHSQYDLWRPNPTDDPEAFRDRTFLVVGGGYPVDDFKGVFESVTLDRDVVYSEHGHAVSRWVIFICRKYHGFDPSRRPGNEAQH